ncbi:MAG: hypothetical protein JNL58_32290 [Planctomyces sp.]|nr:hypothetical protein [Planctomyces sp.]
MTVSSLGVLPFALLLTFGCAIGSVSQEQMVGDWISANREDTIERLKFRDDGTVLYRCTVSHIDADGQIVEKSDPSFRPLGGTGFRVPIYIEHFNAEWVVEGNQCIVRASTSAGSPSTEAWRSGRGMAVFEPGEEIFRVNVRQSDLIEIVGGRQFHRDSRPPLEIEY